MLRKLRKHFLKLFIAWVVLTAGLLFFALRSEYVADKVYNYALAYLEENLQSRIVMGKPEIDWLRGSWHISNISVMTRFGREKREFIAAKNIRISFFPWWNILKREIGIRFIEVEEPSIYVRIEKGRIANLPFFDFLKGQKGLFRFVLREVRISEGRMLLSLPEKQGEITINNIDMKIRPDIDKNQHGFILADSSASIKVRDFRHRITSLKGEFSISPEHLTAINSTFLLPEGRFFAEGLYLDFATERWETKVSSEMNLAALKKSASGRLPWISERIKEIKGRATVSATVRGDKNGFDVKGGINAKDVELEGFRITDTSAAISCGGKWDSIKESSFNIELRSKVPVEMAGHYVEKLPRIKGVADLHIKGSADGVHGATKIEGDITSPHIDLAGVPVKMVSVKFNAGKEDMQIKDLTAELMGGSLKGGLDFNLKSEKRFRGGIHLENIDLKELSNYYFLNNNSKLRTQNPELKIVGSATGDVSIAGTVEPEPVFDGRSTMQIQGLNISYGDSSITRVPTCGVRSEVSYKRGVTTFRPVEVDTPSSAASVSGYLFDDRRLSLVFSMKSSDLSEFGRQMKGAGTINGRVSGSVDGPEIDGNLDFTGVRWGKYNADTVSGSIGFKDRTISSTGLLIGNGKSGISLKGELSTGGAAPAVDAVIETENGRLEDIISMAGLDLRAEGDISVSGRVRGRVSALDGEIDIKGSGLTVMGEDLGAVRIGGKLNRGRLILENGEISRDGENVTFSGEIDTEGDINVKVSSLPLSLKGLPFVKKADVPLKGTVELEGKVSGNIKNPSFKGRGILNGAGYREIDLGDGSIDVSISDKLLSIYGNVSGVHVAGTMLLGDKKTFHVALDAEELPLDRYFKGTLEGLTGVISGGLKAEGDISEPGDIAANGYVSKLEIVREPFLLKNARDIEFELRNGKIIFKSFQLNGKGTELSASGWIGMDGEANLAVEGSLDLYLLQLFTKVIDKGAGNADVRLMVSGRPPRIEGKVVVKEGVIVFRGFEPVFRNIAGDIVLKGETLVVEALSGRIGEGGFKGDGTIEMAGLSLKRTDIAFDVSGVHLAYPKWLPAEMEGTLRLSGEYPSFLLSGDINVVKARYSEKVDWRTLLPSFKQRLREPQALKEGEGVLKLDINFRADRNLVFENNVGKGELKGEIRLKGDTSRFGIVGDVEVITGKVFYKEHEFKISSGVIEFPDSARIEPVFDFTAEGKVRDYTIQILAQGNINDLKVTMTSSPPLSDLDIASLLSFGLTTKELQERGGGAPVYGAASILSREVEDKFKDYIGFDRFHIDPYYSKVTGTTEPKLTVGKDLSDDVLVIYSRSLSGAGEQEAQMEYKLYRNFSVVGGWSSFGASNQGDVGADMKFRFEFR